MTKDSGRLIGMRTEEAILQDFRRLGYKVRENNRNRLKLQVSDFIIDISKINRVYRCYFEYDEVICCIEMEEHKLLHELFECWGWL